MNRFPTPRKRRRAARGFLTANAIAVAALLLVSASAEAARADGAAPDPSPDVTSPSVTRIAGADRFDEAVKIAQQAYPAGAATVYLASGTGFADALSAGPAAANNHAPLLLVLPDSIPPVVAGEIAALKPARIVVAGGPASVADSVLTQLHSLVPGVSVQRISGADRYEVSRALVRDAFPSGAPGIFLSTGRDFPDALSAAAAGAAIGSPAILVDGQASTLDGESTALITSWSPPAIGIVGGTGSVSAGIGTAAKSLVWNTLRFSGADRYRVSIAVNQGVFFNFDTVYFATGANFPDALVGGVLTSIGRSPLFLVPGTCVPRDVLAQLSANGTTHVVLLGGPVSLTDDVRALKPCTW